MAAEHKDVFHHTRDFPYLELPEFLGGKTDELWKIPIWERMVASQSSFNSPSSWCWRWWRDRADAVYFHGTFVANPLLASRRKVRFGIFGKCWRSSFAMKSPAPPSARDIITMTMLTMKRTRELARTFWHTRHGDRPPLASRYDSPSHVPVADEAGIRPTSTRPYVWSCFFFVLFCNLLGAISLAGFARREVSR